MNDLTQFIRARRIDSFQKLRLLIFLHRHPESSWTSQEIAEQLYLGDVPLLEGILADLRSTGLLDCVANRCTLHDEVDVRSCLQCLAETCDDPLARQQILDQITHGTFLTGHYQEDVNESY
jgi:hypothetical protein